MVSSSRALSRGEEIQLSLKVQVTGASSIQATINFALSVQAMSACRCALEGSARSRVGEREGESKCGIDVEVDLCHLPRRPISGNDPYDKARRLRAVQAALHPTHFMISHVESKLMVIV